MKYEGLFTNGTLENFDCPARRFLTHPFGIRINPYAITGFSADAFLISLH